LERLSQIVTLLFGLISGCGASDKASFFGNWVRSEGTLSCENSFHRDGTFDGRCMDRGLETWSFSGQWQVAGKTLSYEYKESSSKQIPPGTKDVDEVVAIAPNYYVVKGLDGAPRRYQRSTP
jgi:hypothetical protein